MLSTLISETSNINNKCILWNVFGYNIVVTAKQKYDLWFSLHRFESNSEFESINLALTSVKDIEAIPTFLLVHEA